MLPIKLFRLVSCLFRFNRNIETLCFGIEAKQPKQTFCFGQCRNQFRFQFRLFRIETSFEGHPSCGGGGRVGCPSKPISIRNNRNWNRNQFRHYPKQNVCFGCFPSIPKQKVSMFRLNRNKQKTNRNSLIESIFWYFSENLGLFRFDSKQFGLLRLFQYRFETLKQTKNFSFWFHKTN